MKASLVSFLIFFISFSFSSAQTNTFEKIIDTLGCELAACIQQTFDGGYVFCGKSSFGGNDAIIVKLDSMGTIEWAKVYSGPGIEAASYIEQTPDSGFMVNALYDGGLSWLLRLDPDGDTLWTKTYSVGTGATYVNLGNSMASLNNSIYGLTGYLSPQPVNYAYLISAMSNGFQLSNKIYNTSIYSTGSYAIEKTFSGGFIISAWYGTSLLSQDFYLLLTDALGDTIWTRTYDYSQGDIGKDIKQTSDSGFIIAGVTWNNLTFNYNIYLIKTDADGDTLWTKLYSNPNEQGIYSIANANDGGFIIVGVSPNGTLNPDVYLIKTDQKGDTIWTKFYGGPSSDQGFFVMPTIDNGYIIGGTGCINNKCGAYIIKTDSLGVVHSGTGIAELNNPFEFSVFPNPSSGGISFRCRGLPPSGAQLHVINITGQTVYSQKIFNGTHHQELSLPSGIYVVLLTFNHKKIPLRIIIY